MRSILFLSLVFVGACAAHPSAPVVEPALRIPYGDLALETVAGRAALRERINVAVRTYCRANDRDVAPQLVRNKAGYCVEAVRRSLVAEMPHAVQRRYFQH